MLKQVATFVSEWNAKERPHYTSGHNPPQPNDNRGLQGATVQEPDTLRTQNGHHARDTTEQEQNKNKKLQRLVRVWDEMEAVRLEHQPNGKQRKIGKRRVTLMARIEEHGADEVVHCWRWMHEADDPRARYLRENGYGIDTFMRASKLRDYMDRASQWQPGQDSMGADWFDDAQFDDHGNLLEQ
tara:strand:+ start:1159 stop:1710 length:552 start_codon:yes stop_codon:yes gene_type:complete